MIYLFVLMCGQWYCDTYSDDEQWDLQEEMFKHVENGNTCVVTDDVEGFCHDMDVMHGDIIFVDEE